MSTPPGLPSVESVLTSLRRGQRQLARTPRAALQSAVKQLLALGPGTPTGQPGQPGQPGSGGATQAPADATYRIDELSRASGVTVRNVRAYQERGLLPPPQRVGRTALFDATHLVRLRVISSMLDRGYTAAHIRELLQAWEHGHDLSHVLGLEGARVPPIGDEPLVVTTAEAKKLAGGAADYELLREAGLVEAAGRRVRVLRPRLLEAFAEMRAYGVTSDVLLDVHRQVQPYAERIASVLASAGAARLGPLLAGDEPPTSADVGDLVVLLTRFRALAMSAVSATMAAALEEAIERLLADYLAERVLGDGADIG